MTSVMERTPGSPLPLDWRVARAVDKSIDKRESRKKIASFLLSSVQASGTEPPEIVVMPEDPSRLLKIARAFNVISEDPMERPLPLGVEMELADYEVVRDQLNQKVEPMLMPMFDGMSQLLR